MTGRKLHPVRAGLLLASVVGAVLFWHSPFFLPFKLLAVMGHETGHALASLAAGGSVERVTLRLNESGACLSRVPSGFFAQTLVYSAGYVGSAVISVLLLILSFRLKAGRSMLAAACAWLGLMGLFYARDGFTLLFSLVMALLFALSAKWLPDAGVAALNLFIASFTALYAVMDLKDDLWNATVRAQSDAQLLSSLTLVPSLVWAVLWTLVSLSVVLAGAFIAVHESPVSRPRAAFASAERRATTPPPR